MSVFGLLLLAATSAVPHARAMLLERSGDIYTLQPNGSGLHRVSRGQVVSINPAWSPDGKKIVFAGRWANQNQPHLHLFTMSSAGTNVTDLTPKDADDNYLPTWSPNGTLIAYNDGDKLAIMNADGRGQHDLGKINPFSRASWSPDDGHVACSLWGETADPQIYIVNVKSGMRTQLTDIPGGATHPVWSPDGRSIAFVAGAIRQIYLMDPAGKHQRRLLPLHMDLSDPAWSPDSKKIAFIARLRRKYAIGVVNGDGSDEKMILPFSPASIGDLSW